MQIKEILSDNAVVSLDEGGREVIAAGRGIAFRMERGNEIDEKKVQLTLSFTNEETKARFKKIAADIPLEYILLSNRIIRYAKETYGKKLAETIYVTITEHIYRVIGRQSYGFQMKNALRWEIRHIYREEFLIGKKAIDMLQRQCMVELHEDEAAFIALIFVNAELSGDIENIVEVTKLIQTILKMIRAHFKLEYKEESLNYSRLVTHLKFLAKRIFGEKEARESDEEMYDMMSSRYLAVAECVRKIKAMIAEEYDYDLTKDEQMYLIIHIVKILKD
jgi:beta-glucoside operon transcriptional antiterminator